MNELQELDLARYLAVLRKWLWLIVACTLLAGGTAYAVSSTMTPIYEATATMLLEQGGLSPSNLIWGNNQWEALTYVELVPRLLPETAARLGLEEVDAKNVSVDAIRDTRVLQIRVRDPNPQLAADIANAIPEVFSDYTESLRLSRYTESKAALRAELDRLETEIAVTQQRIEDLGEAADATEKTELTRLEETLTQQRYNYGQLLTTYETMRLAEMQAKGNLVVFKSAAVPTQPVFPKTKLNTLLAAVVGAMLATGVAFLVEHLDDTLKTPEDVTRAMGLITLGNIARLSSRRGNGEDRLVTITDPLSPDSEAFRDLRTNVKFSSVDRPIGRLLVTSPAPSNGKSFVAANLSIAFAQDGHSVVLVDADLRRPTQHKFFDMSNGSGLTDSLLDGANPGADKWLQSTSEEGLHLLSSGSLPPNPAELVGSQRMWQITEHLNEQFDMVVLDSPPVLAVTDAAALSRQVDGVILVVEAGSTREREARRAVEALAKVDAPILGVVLNKIPVGRHGSYDYYYYRHYRYTESGEKKKESRRNGGIPKRIRDVLRRVTRSARRETQSQR
jgi:non-specific protein-tyrosine kinase